MRLPSSRRFRQEAQRPVHRPAEPHGGQQGGRVECVSVRETLDRHLDRHYATAFILGIAQLGPVPVLAPSIFWLYWAGRAGWATALLIWSLPVVMLTAKKNSQDLALGVQVGADAYITKPFKSAKVIEVIDGLISGRGGNKQ